MLEFNNGEIDGTTSTTIEVVDGTEFDTPAYFPIREGYDFIGWSTDANDTETISFPQVISEDTTYYAIYKIKTFVYTFDANGGQIYNRDGYYATYPITFNYGQTPYLPQNKPTWTGATFQGYGETPTATVDELVSLPDQVYEDKTFYAVWTWQTYRVILDPNGNPATPWQWSVSGTVNDNIMDAIAKNSSVQNMTWEGYTFIGWGTSTTSTKPISTDMKFPASNLMVLYAIWEPVEGSNELTGEDYLSEEAPHVVAVTLDANGGTINGEEGDYHQSLNGTSEENIFDSLVIRFANVVRNGYEFIGWGWDPNSTDVIGNTEKFPDTDKTLYAIWEIPQEES